MKQPNYIPYSWDLGGVTTAYKTVVDGWYDIGNTKYIYKLKDGLSVIFDFTDFGPEPVEYLERKEK